MGKSNLGNFVLGFDFRIKYLLRRFHCARCQYYDNLFNFV